MDCIKDINELTPVQKIGDFYFKRDDKFMPFDDIPINGGKVRQCMCLMRDAKEHIVKECNSRIVTATGMTSPQGIIVSRVAREYGFTSTIFVGQSNINLIKNNPKKYPLMTNIMVVGGDINTDCKIAYESGLEKTIDKWCLDNGDAFRIKFGINMHEYNDAIIGSVSNQVRNLPDSIDYLIVPCGSCIMLSGILSGLKKYNKNVGKVIGIQIAGIDRTKSIENILDDKFHIPYDFRLSTDFKRYNIPCKLEYNGLGLDWLYEGKAFFYMQNHMMDEIRGKNVCFWVVGNSTSVRTNIFE